MIQWLRQVLGLRAPQRIETRERAQQAVQRAHAVVTASEEERERRRRALRLELELRRRSR